MNISIIDFYSGYVVHQAHKAFVATEEVNPFECWLFWSLAFSIEFIQLNKSCRCMIVFFVQLLLYSNSNCHLYNYIYSGAR